MPAPLPYRAGNAGRPLVNRSPLMALGTHHGLRTGITHNRLRTSLE
jgi:hypothetical protein